MELKTFFAQDQSGNVMPFAVVTVYQAGTLTPATGLETQDAAPLSNPFTADNDGKVSFYAPDGLYDISVVSGSRSVSIRVQFSADAQDLRDELDDSTGSSLVGFIQSGAGAVARTVQDKSRDVVSVEDFGAVGSDPVKDTAAFLDAVASGAGAIELGGKNYHLSSTVEIPDNTILRGKGNASTITAVSDIVPIVVGGPFAGLFNFRITKTGTHTKSGVEVGNATATKSGGRCAIRGVTVDGMGADGITVHNGNLGSITDVVCINNGQDGIRFSDATADNNAWTFDGFVDLRSNTRHGLFFEGGSGFTDANSSRSHAGTVITQNNGGDGVKIESTKNTLTVYSEANAGAQVSLDALSRGNVITTLEGSVADFGQYNLVWFDNGGASAWRVLQGILRMQGAGGLQLGNDTALGTLRLYHDTNAVHKFYAQDTGQSQFVRWKNTADLENADNDAAIHAFVHDFRGAVIARDRLIFTSADTTPDVSLSEFWLANNSAATTITAFDGGQTGQIIVVVFNNGNTTIQHSTGTTGIRLKSGANKTYAQYESAQFIKNGANWWIEI